MAEPTSLGDRVTLNNGVAMPCFGLGVYNLGTGRAAESAMGYALQAGYRLIDTAKLYRNEAEVGRAVRNSGLPREEVFVTTKLWNSDHGHDPALRAFDRSLKELGLEYVDLYLIHWPVSGARRETWKALEEIQASGRARAIGVSNYMVRHLEELLGHAEIVPAVDQVEMNPFLAQAELRAYCREQGIQLEAYSPLTKGHRLNDPGIATMARRHGRTPAQIMLRWCLQVGAIPIPKSSRPERILENGRVFDFTLGPEDMEALGKLDESLHTGWDPTREP